MRQEPRSALLVTLGLSVALAGALLFMVWRGWLDFDSGSASAKGTEEAGDRRAATATCEQAADRYVTCMGELLGPSGKEVAASKRDVESCTRDPKTVAMYEHCLPKSGCEPFLNCMTDYASKTGP